MSFADLLGVDEQIARLKYNTQRFLTGKPANNALLLGIPGNGQVVTHQSPAERVSVTGLRLIEVDKDDLLDLPEIVDDIRELKLKFILFCDDLSFERGESHYKALKSILEGSIELPPDNVLLYATSNRRHLVPEYMKDNEDAKIVGGELHPTEAIEELVSLSDRFGLWLSFTRSINNGIWK